jgi:hypothetical protein
LSGEPTGGGPIKPAKPYSYSRRGNCWAIYRKVTDGHQEKIADVCLRADDGQQMAFEMVAALNSRARWKESQNQQNTPGQ